MILHYLAVALAKFRMAPFTTAANVLTLALGLACFIAAFGIASWWRSADGYHPGADRIVHVTTKSETPMALPGGANPLLELFVSSQLADQLRAELPELEAVARIRASGELAVASADAKTFLPSAVADAELFDLFEFTFVQGDRANALRTPNDVVLLEDAARRLFGDAPALGQRLIVDDDWEAVVSGVVAPVRQPSFMGQGPNAFVEFEILTSAERQDAFMLPAPGAPGLSFSGAMTFARLPETVPLAAFSERLAAFAERRFSQQNANAAPPPPADEGGLVAQAPEDGRMSTAARRGSAPRATMVAAPVREMTARLVDARFRAQAIFGLSTAAVLLGLGTLILIVACVNYANLASAQTIAAARTMGLRKVLGARRIDILVQYWLEAGVLMLAALVAALIAIALAAPVIETYVGANVLAFLGAGPRGAMFLALVILVASAAAAAWPALTVARVSAATALGEGARDRGIGAVARVLVGVQFLSASFLLIFFTVMQLQTSELRRLGVKSREDPVVILNDLADADVNPDTLSAQLAAFPQIRGVTMTTWLPWSADIDNIEDFTRSLDAGATRFPTYMRPIGYGYFDIFGLDLAAGRLFEAGRDTPPDGSQFGPDAANPPDIVVDERLVRGMGFADPQSAVGELIYFHPPSRPGAQQTRPPVALRILGVVEADLTAGVERQHAGSMYVLFPPDPSGAQGLFPILRIAREDVPGAIAAITRVWDELAPNIPVDIRFMDDLFEQSMAAFDRMRAAFVGLALSAFAISTFGLLGVAMHVAARRRHEIGVRKTLGASTLRIIRLLLIDFSKPVLIANLLAWPLGYLAAEAYLAQFAERVALTPAPFALSMAITLAIAWAAVIGEVLKAASVRPAEVLRHA